MPTRSHSPHVVSRPLTRANDSGNLGRPRPSFNNNNNGYPARAVRPHGRIRFSPHRRRNVSVVGHQVIYSSRQTDRRHRRDRYVPVNPFVGRRHDITKVARKMPDEHRVPQTRGLHRFSHTGPLAPATIPDDLQEGQDFCEVYTFGSVADQRGTLATPYAESSSSPYPRARRVRQDSVERFARYRSSQSRSPARRSLDERMRGRPHHRSRSRSRGRSRLPRSIGPSSPSRTFRRGSGRIHSRSRSPSIIRAHSSFAIRDSDRYSTRSVPRSVPIHTAPHPIPAERNSAPPPLKKVGKVVLSEGIPTDGLPLPATTPNFVQRFQWLVYVWWFLITALPQEIYLYALLHLPSLYYSRVTKVYTDAELCMPDIMRMYTLTHNDLLDEELTLKNQPPGSNKSDMVQLLRFKASWEEFIDSLVTEWQVQNVVAVLLLSAVLTLLQIEDISRDPLSRTTTVFSLIFALMSLLHGCVYMIRFGSMKKLYKAAVWAEEAQRTTTHTLWNVWVFLALPAVWLSWSVITFLVTILSYVWRTGADEQYEPLTMLHALGVRVAVTSFAFLGMVYFGLALWTLAQYGSKLDNRWDEKVDAWRYEEADVPSPRYYPVQPPHSRTPRRRVLSYSPIRLPSRYPRALSSSPNPHPASTYPAKEEGSNTHAVFEAQLLTEGTSASKTVDNASGPYEALMASRLYHPASEKTTTIPTDTPDAPRTFSFDFELGDGINESFNAHHDVLDHRGITIVHWELFHADLLRAWKDTLDIPNRQSAESSRTKRTIVNNLIDFWNTKYFVPRCLEVAFEEGDEEEHIPKILFYELPILDATARPSTRTPSPTAAEVANDDLANT